MTIKRGHLYLFSAALSYALMGILVKFLAKELGPFSQTFLRFIVSGTMTFLLVKMTKKTLKLKNKSDYLLVVFMGVFGYAISIIAYTMAFEFTSVGNVLFILSSYTIFATLFAFMFLKEKPRPGYLYSLIFLAIGFGMIFNPNSLSSHLKGNFLAVISSVTFALYIVASRYLSKRNNHPVTITFWTVFIATVTAGLGTIFFESLDISIISTQSLLGIIIFGFLNFAAFNLINLGFKTISTSTGTMILLLEAIFGSTLGLIFFGEIPTLTLISGAVAIVIAVWFSL